MPQSVFVKQIGTNLHFPDAMSPEEINNKINFMFPAPPPPAPPQPSPEEIQQNTAGTFKDIPGSFTRGFGTGLVEPMTTGYGSFKQVGVEEGSPEERSGQEIVEAGREFTKDWQPRPDEVGLKNVLDPNWLAYNIGALGGSTVPVVTASVALGAVGGPAGAVVGAGLGMAAASIMEMGGVYQEMIASGKSKEERDDAYWSGFGAFLALNSLSLGLLARLPGGPALMSAAIGGKAGSPLSAASLFKKRAAYAATEVATEMAEEPLSEVIKGENPWTMETVERMIAVGIPSVFVSGGTSVAVPTAREMGKKYVEDARRWLSPEEAAAREATPRTSEEIQADEIKTEEAMAAVEEVDTLEISRAAKSELLRKHKSLGGIAEDVLDPHGTEADKYESWQWLLGPVRRTTKIPKSYGDPIRQTDEDVDIYYESIEGGEGIRIREVKKYSDQRAGQRTIINRLLERQKKTGKTINPMDVRVIGEHLLSRSSGKHPFYSEGTRIENFLEAKGLEIGTAYPGLSREYREKLTRWIQNNNRGMSDEEASTQALVLEGMLQNLSDYDRTGSSVSQMVEDAGGMAAFFHGGIPAETTEGIKPLEEVVAKAKREKTLLSILDSYGVDTIAKHHFISQARKAGHRPELQKLHVQQWFDEQVPGGLVSVAELRNYITQEQERIAPLYEWTAPPTGSYVAPLTAKDIKVSGQTQRVTVKKKREAPLEWKETPDGRLEVEIDTRPTEDMVTHLVRSFDIADPSTAPHELMHVAVGMARGPFKADLEKLMGKSIDKFTSTDMEDLAIGWEMYLLSAKERAPDASGSYESTMEWLTLLMRKAYNFKKGVPLPKLSDNSRVAGKESEYIYDILFGGRKYAEERRGQWEENIPGIKEQPLSGWETITPTPYDLGTPRTPTVDPSATLPGSVYQQTREWAPVGEEYVPQETATGPQRRGPGSQVPIGVEGSVREVLSGGRGHTTGVGGTEAWVDVRGDVVRPEHIEFNEKTGEARSTISIKDETTGQYMPRQLTKVFRPFTPIKLSDIDKYGEGILDNPREVRKLTETDPIDDIQTLSLMRVHSTLTDPSTNKALIDKFRKYDPDLIDKIRKKLSFISSQSGQFLRSRRYSLAKENAIRMANEMDIWNQLSKETQESFVNSESAVDLFTNFMVAKKDPKSKWKHIVLALMYENMLSGPSTQIVNVVGNAIWQPYLMANRALTGVLDNIWNTYNKVVNPNKPMIRRRYATESFDMFKSFISGKTHSAAAKKGYDHFMGDAFNFEDMTSLSDSMGLINYQFIPLLAETSKNPTQNRRWAKLATMSSRAMMSTDLYFKAIASQQQATAVTRRLNQGTVAENHIARLDYVQDILRGKRKRMEHTGLAGFDKASIRMTPTKFDEMAKDLTVTRGVDKIREAVTKDNIHEMTEADILRNFDKWVDLAIENDAAMFAEHATFQNDYGAWMKTVDDVRGYKTYGWGRIVIPFMKTATNLAKRGLELTPGLGIAVAKTGPRPLLGVEIAAKQIEGLMITLFVWWLMENDKLTGDAPEAKAERDAFFRSGKIAQGFDVGKTWVSYRRIEPLAYPISLLANLYNEYKDAQDPLKPTSEFDVLVKAVNVTKEHIIENSFMRSIEEPLENERGLQRQLGWMAGGFMPYSGFWRGLYAEYEAAFSGSVAIRENNTFADTFGNSLPPGVREIFGWDTTSSKPRIDVFGKEIRRQSNWFMEWTPVRFQDKSPDKTEKVLQALKYYPPFPDRVVTIGKGRLQEKVWLSDDDYAEFVVRIGQRAKKLFDARTANWTVTDENEFMYKKTLNKMFNSIKLQERNRLKTKIKRDMAAKAEELRKGLLPTESQ